MYSYRVDTRPQQLRIGDAYLIDPVAHFFDVEGSSDGPVLEDDVDGDLAPSGLRGVHGERERISRSGLPGILLIRNLQNMS